MTQLSVGQKLSEPDTSDDKVISNRRISPFSLSKIKSNIPTGKVTNSDTYVLDKLILDAIIAETPESLILNIPIGTSYEDILLRKIKITSENYLLKTSSGIERSLPRDVTTYRGIVDGSQKKCSTYYFQSKKYI